MSTAMFAAEMVVKASWQFPSSEAFRAKIAEWSPTSSKEDLDAAVAAYRENAVTQETPGQPKVAIESQEIVPEWETPAHKEVDPFDADYDLVNATSAVESGLIPYAKAAIDKGFHIFGLTPKDKVTLPGSHGFKDSKAPSDPLALSPWEQDPNRNIGLDLGASDLCVLDFDKPESIPAWLNEIKTYKVRTGKGVHVYFRGARKTTKLYVDGNGVGDVKSTGGYVLSEGSVHPSGAIYTVIDDSPIVDVPERVSELVKHDSERVNASTDGPPIPYGSHDTELFRTACSLRNAGLGEQKITELLIEVCEARCEGYGSDYKDMCRNKAKSACKYPVGQATPVLLIGGVPTGTAGAKQITEAEATPVVDDPSDNDSRFEMPGEAFDTKVYEDVSRRFTPYPDPGENDLISVLAKKLVEGTPIPLAYVREPLKAAVLHAIDGKVVHPAHRKLTMRGNYFSLGESEGGKTTGLEYAINACNVIFSTNLIHEESLFRYKSEQTFIRSFTPEGTIKRDAQGNIKSGHAGHPSQFLYVKEGNLVANSSDYFAAVFAMLTNLYDQTEAATESMTNGTFDAATIRTSTVMCFTPTDYAATFGGKGNIGGGGLNRWGIVNPQPDHSYDDKDWEPLSDQKIQDAINPLTEKVFNLKQSEPIVLVEEAGAVKIRLEVKSMLKKAGKAGKRLLEYFMREQVAQAVVALDGRMVMTTQQAVYAREWVEAQVMCRLNCWPSDASNQIEGMEHAIRKAVNRHFVSETALKDACHLYREGSGGWYAFNAARSNMVQSEAIKPTGKTRKGVRTYCPGSCAIHPPVKKDAS